MATKSSPTKYWTVHSGPPSHGATRPAVPAAAFCSHVASTVLNVALKWNARAADVDSFDDTSLNSSVQSPPPRLRTGA